MYKICNILRTVRDERLTPGSLESRLNSIGTKSHVYRVGNEQKVEKIQVEVQPLDLKFSSKFENAPALNVLTTKCKNLKIHKNTQNIKFSFKMMIWCIFEFFMLGR